MDPQGPARRTVMRASAWSVPVIAVGVTAPAYAASPVGARLIFDTANIYYAEQNGSRPTRLESKVQVQNVWVAGAPTVTSLELTVSYPKSAVSGAVATAVSGMGWSQKTVEDAGQRWIYRFAWIGSAPPGASTPELIYRVPLRIAAYTVGETVTASFTAAASGGVATRSDSYTLPP